MCVKKTTERYKLLEGPMLRILYPLCMFLNSMKGFLKTNRTPETTNVKVYLFPKRVIKNRLSSAKNLRSAVSMDSPKTSVSLDNESEIMNLPSGDPLVV